MEERGPGSPTPSSGGEMMAEAAEKGQGSQGSRGKQNILTASKERGCWGVQGSEG